MAWQAARQPRGTGAQASEVSKGGSRAPASTVQAPLRPRPSCMGAGHPFACAAAEAIAHDPCAQTGVPVTIGTAVHGATLRQAKPRTHACAPRAHAPVALLERHVGESVEVRAAPQPAPWHIDRNDTGRRRRWFRRRLLAHLRVPRAAGVGPRRTHFVVEEIFQVGSEVCHERRVPGGAVAGCKTARCTRHRRRARASVFVHARVSVCDCDCDCVCVCVCVCV